ARLALKPPGGGIVAAIIGGHAIAVPLERDRDGEADAARSSRHKCNSCHLALPLSLALPQVCSYADRVKKYLDSPVIPAEAMRAIGEQLLRAGTSGVPRLTRSRIASPFGFGFRDDGCLSIPLHAHGDAHAAADAQRGEASLGVAPLHLEQEGVEHAGAGGADGVADGDGAAVHVHLLGVPAESLVD